MAAANVTADRRKRPVAGVGRVMVWHGASLWIGEGIGLIAAHSHHAIQISLALEGRFRIRGPGWPDWRETPAVVVMPDTVHALDGCQSAVASIFVEPNSRPGAALRERFANHPVALLGDGEAQLAAAGLREAFFAQASDERLMQHSQGAICRIAGDPAAAPGSDARITAALAWMHEHLARPIRLQDVAKVVHLSPGRFRHLFVAQTGTSFRAWLLWARAEAAICAATRGVSWTEAAQEAGFADAAHFTRTCRRVFGIAPTMLVFQQVQGRDARAT